MSLSLVRPRFCFILTFVVLATFQFCTILIDFHLLPHYENVTKKEKKKERKPILYLHVGPPKTATTTIQQKLTEYRKDLMENGILYLGKDQRREKWVKNFPHPLYCTMYQQYAQRANNVKPSCVDVMNQTLNDYYNQSMKNILNHSRVDNNTKLIQEENDMAMMKDILMSDEVIGIMFSDFQGGKNQGRAEGALKLFASMILPPLPPNENDSTGLDIDLTLITLQVNSMNNGRLNQRKRN